MALKVCQLCAVDFTLKNFLLPLLDGMLSEGWHVTAVCSDGQSVSSLRSQGYRIHTIPIARSMNPILALRSIFLLTLYLRRHSFDVVHVHTPVAALIGRIAAKLAGTSLVVYTAHGFYFHDHMPLWKRSLFLKLEKALGSLTDLLFCQSAEDAATAIQERIASARCVVAIGNGVDTARFNPSCVPPGETVRVSLGIPQDAYVVAMIGRLVREKGIEEFLEAMATLASRYKHLWVVLVGDRLESDHDQDVAKSLSAAHALLGNRLIALGARDDIPEVLAATDLFCLPSWREGMPRTIIEAMMMAKPVVATNIRGSREEVVHEETGLLVPIQSPPDIINAIEKFLLNPSWGISLGLAGRKRALQLYDENSVVALQLSHIRHMMLAH